MPIISDWDVRHNDTLYPAAKPFDLSVEEEQLLVDDGIARYVEYVEREEVADVAATVEMTIPELKAFLQSVEFIEDVEELLKKEQSKADPRKTAVGLMEQWLKEAEADEDLQGNGGEGQPDDIS